MNFPALPYSTAYRSQWRQHDGCRSVNTGVSHADDRCQGQRCGGLAHRCKAAPAGSRSVRARRSPGARTMAYVSLPGSSAFTCFAHSPFDHEFGHFLRRDQVRGREEEDIPRPLRVTWARSWVRSASSAISESRALTSESYITVMERRFSLCRGRTTHGQLNLR